MAEQEIKNIQINGRTYPVADEKARKQIDEQNKNLGNKLEWELLGEVSGSTSKTLTVNDWKTKYKEFLLTGGYQERVLISSTIPISVATATIGTNADAYEHQIFYGNTSSGNSFSGGALFLSDTQIKISCYKADRKVKLFAR